MCVFPLSSFLQFLYASSTWQEKDDRPLIVQFAAKDPIVLGRASQFVARFVSLFEDLTYGSQCDGVDINCGCPQPWAIKEGYGCGTLTKPELIAQMVKEAREMANLPCSIKIRVNPDIKYVELCIYSRTKEKLMTWWNKQKWQVWLG